MSLKELEKLTMLSKLTGLTRLVDLVPLYYKIMHEAALHKQTA
jgi:hypothetical protein